MKLVKIIIILLIAAKTYADLPMLEFNPSASESSTVDIKKINDSITSFLASNLLLDEVDVYITEQSESQTITKSSENTKLALQELLNFKNNVSKNSIHQRESLEQNVLLLKKLIEKYPTIVKAQPQGKLILIQTNEKQISVNIVKI